MNIMDITNDTRLIETLAAIESVNDEMAQSLNAALQNATGQHDKHFVSSIDDALALPLPDGYRFWAHITVPTNNDGCYANILDNGIPLFHSGIHHKLPTIAICKAWLRLRLIRPSE